MDEKELLARCLTGDDAAWRALVERYDASLARLARLVLRAFRRPADDWEVDEVKSGVLELLVAHDYRVLRAFRWQCSFETWLRVLVRTVCVRRIRRKTVDPGDLVKDAPGEQPLERLVNEETQAAVRKALDSLPPRDRLILTMFFIDGRSYREIASFAGIPMGTVATVLSRSRQVLKDMLKSKGIVEDVST